MYGRCETDPFDQAVDVCDSCYGEFCDQCLVMTKGRKHPICHECVMVASGLRPGSKPLMRGSKKTAESRRQTLQATPRSAPVFQSFDAEPTPPVDADQPVVANAERPEPDESDVGAEPTTTAAGSAESPESPESPESIASLTTTAPTDDDLDHVESSPPQADHGTSSPASGFRRPRPFIDQVGPNSKPAVASPAPTPAPASTSETTSASASASPPITGIEWTVVPEADTAPLPRRRSRPSDESDHTSDDAAMETTSRR